MNLGFIIPTMYRGGAERAMSIVCNKMVERGHNVTLMLTEDATDRKNPLDERIEIVDLTNDINKYLLKIPRYVDDISKVIKDRKLDLVVSFIVRTNVSAILACKKAKIPVIVSERNDPYSIPADFTSRILRNVVYRYSDGFVFQTKYARDYFPKKIQDRSVIIMNPTSHEIAELPQSIKKEDVIISASRLEEQKNLPMLIEAFSRLEKEYPTYRVDIYGVGGHKDNIQKIINDKGLVHKIVLKGLVIDVIQRVASSNIFVLCSNFEGFSNALVEAMCAGTACIATDSPTYGNREIIEDGKNAFLIPVNDVDALTEKLKILMDNEKLRVEMGRNAKTLYDKTNSDVIADQWEKYIVEIYNRRKK